MRKFIKIAPLVIGIMGQMFVALFAFVASAGLVYRAEDAIQLLPPGLFTAGGIVATFVCVACIRAAIHEADCNGACRVATR